MKPLVGRLNFGKDRAVPETAEQLHHAREQGRSGEQAEGGPCEEEHNLLEELAGYGTLKGEAGPVLMLSSDQSSPVHACNAISNTLLKVREMMSLLVC